MDDSGRLLSFPQAPDAVELRHLRAFVAVAEELNFGRAATRLYVSQPALSRQIRALERLVGCELLRRSTHRVELTLAGDALLDRARPILRDVDDAVAATQSVGGELANRVARLWQPMVDLTAGEADLQEMRAAYESLHAEFAPPPDLQVAPVNAGGVHALALTTEAGRPTTILYLHGGGYVLGSAFGYRPLPGALAAAARTGVLVPEYRLAPEHPFPAPLDDALRAYEWMLERGTAPRNVTLAGDSSGGGLVMSLLVALKQRDLPLPGGAVLFCPWVDLTCSLVTREPDDPQVALLAEIGGRCADAYLAGQSPDDPVVSPLRADLTGLPPLLVQAATGDYQRQDAHALADHARSHGVDARLELYPVDTHVFQFFWSFLPEAADALERAGRFASAIAAAPAAVARS
ncbi:MAG TPA: alpha/beta hydrolase fold domain-containing protein [Solirubrobacteraceae bacterium]|nr:alpha/beta hydrolase fold domain-containing protein [Solirubrobacteraceae bacterium]